MTLTLCFFHHCSSMNCNAPQIVNSSKGSQMILKMITLEAIEGQCYQQQRDGWVYEDGKVGFVPHRKVKFLYVYH
jgi:hypothetical protein